MQKTEAQIKNKPNWLERKNLNAILSKILRHYR